MSFYCDTLSVMFFVSGCLMVFAGFLVTVERYLCIVYSMKAGIRINLKIAKVLIISIWLFAFILGSLPLALQIKPFIFDYSCVSSRFTDGTYYLSFLGFVTIFVYLISYILYARIFYTVRKSSLNVGIQREGKLAKRIIIVISSNLFFLLVPNIAGQLLTIDNIKNWITKLVYWNAVVLSCFGINSCLNPFLYAFRSERSRSESKRPLKCRQMWLGLQIISKN
jgi:hypothetical protein